MYREGGLGPSQAVARRPQAMGTPGLAGLPWGLRRRAVKVCDGAGWNPGLQLAAQRLPVLGDAWGARCGCGPHLHPLVLHPDHAVPFADLSRFLPSLGAGVASCQSLDGGRGVTEPGFTQPPREDVLQVVWRLCPFP